MKTNSFVLVIILTLLLLISGLEQRFLYLLFPAIGLLALYNDKFKLHKSKEIKLSLSALSILFFVFIIQYIFNFLGLFTFQGFLRYVTYFCLILFIRRLNSSTLKVFLSAFTLLLIASIPYGIYVSIIQKGRFQFFLSHSNHLAYLCVLLSFYYLKIFSGKTYKKKILVTLLGFIILLTKSTGGLLSYSVLILYAFYNVSNSGLLKKLAFVLPVVIFLGFIISMSERFMNQLSFLEYYNISFILERVQNHQAGGVGSGLWRIIHWLSILYNFFNEENFNIIFGLGIDTMTKGHYQYSFMITDPHNDFVRIMVETGVVGFLIFIYLYLKLIFWAPMSFYLLIVTAMPMMLGNIIVNFPYAIVFSIILILIIKDTNAKNSSSYSLKR